MNGKKNACPGVRQAFSIIVIQENGLFGALDLNGANGSCLNFLEFWKRAQWRGLCIARAATA